MKRLFMSRTKKNATDTASQEPEATSTAPQPNPDKANETTLDRSLYKALLSGLYDGVLIFDSESFVIGSNARAERFFGYSEQDLWNMPCQSLIGSLNAQAVANVRSHAETGRFVVVNAACSRKDGTTFPAEIAISRIDLLNKDDLIFSIRNLERRHKVQKKQELELRAVRFTDAGIAVCSCEGIIECANPAFVRLVACTDETDVLDRPIAEYCVSQSTAQAMLNTPSSAGSWQGVLKLQTAKGHVRQVLATAALSPAPKDQKDKIVLSMTALPTSTVTS